MAPDGFVKKRTIRPTEHTTTYVTENLMLPVERKPLMPLSGVLKTIHAANELKAYHQSESRRFRARIRN